jgi:hypothetical protein
MSPPSTVKVTATINGHRYSASLAGEGVVILGQGRALGTASFIGGKLTRLAPTPPDPFVQIPLDDMDVLDQLAAALRAATAGRAAGGAGG